MMNFFKKKQKTSDKLLNYQNLDIARYTNMTSHDIIMVLQVQDWNFIDIHF